MRKTLCLSFKSQAWFIHIKYKKQSMLCLRLPTEKKQGECYDYQNNNVFIIKATLFLFINTTTVQLNKFHDEIYVKFA